MPIDDSGADGAKEAWSSAAPAFFGGASWVATSGAVDVRLCVSVPVGSGIGCLVASASGVGRPVVGRTVVETGTAGATAANNGAVVAGVGGVGGVGDVTGPAGISVS